MSTICIEILCKMVVYFVNIQTLFAFFLITVREISGKQSGLILACLELCQSFTDCDSVNVTKKQCHCSSVKNLDEKALVDRVTSNYTDGAIVLDEMTVSNTKPS